MLFSMWNPKTAKDSCILSVEQTRISLAPAGIWHLIICGALLEAISTLLSWGAYMSLVGGAFMMRGVVIEKLNVEIVVHLEERREKEKEDDCANGP